MKGEGMFVFGKRVLNNDASKRGDDVLRCIIVNQDGGGDTGGQGEREIM